MLTVWPCCLKIQCFCDQKQYVLITLEHDCVWLILCGPIKNTERFKCYEVYPLYSLLGQKKKKTSVKKHFMDAKQHLSVMLYSVLFCMIFQYGCVLKGCVTVSHSQTLSSGIKCRPSGRSWHGGTGWRTLTVKARFHPTFHPLKRYS